MRCAGCGTELIPGKRFCHTCGARAGVACPDCGASVAPEFQFCPDCGRALAPDELRRSAPEMPESLAHKIRAAQDAVAGERKQVTVLFCDLAGSTAIAERLDPEDYAELLDEYLALAFREIYAREGIVTYSAGDGLMALFGAPVAHEDAPQRAVRAALAIRSALEALNARLAAERGLELRARIGVHTGPVVVGTVGNDLKMDYTAIGDTTNLASRLESLATPGTILVSNATHRLVRGFFDVRPAGPFRVKGKSEPVAAYEVLDEASAATPMTVAAERGLTPLVGREQELAQLAACFERLEGNLAQVVAVVGEAGLGKSRLLYEFRHRLADAPVIFFEGRCSALGQAVPYSPFLAMLKQYFGFLPTDDADTARAKVIGRLGVDSIDKVTREYPALSRLLGMRAGRTVEPAPEELKRETIHAFTHLLVEESEQAPVVMMIEDLHWIDDASRELLESLVARLASARLMVLVTHRPEDRAAWRTRAALTQLVLRRLSDDDVRRIVRAVAGGPLPAELERLLVAKAEGSPFCAEEITRSLIEEGYLATNGGGPTLTRPLEEIRIPATVHEVVAARLDRLGPHAKRVVQVAAVLGRQFRHDRLAALLADEGLDVDRALAQLEQRGVVHRKHLLAGDEYRFGESVTQEVAYEGLLLRQRRQLHERIGTLIAAEPGEMTAERAALLAHHFSRGEDRQRAVEALLRAADHAERLPSYRNAAEFYRRAWELADVEPMDAAGRQAALAATLGIARLSVLFGWPPLPEAQPAARRARELAEAGGDTEALAGALYFLGVMIMLAEPGEYARGLALTEQAVAVAEAAGLKPMVLRLSRGLAINHAYDGRFDLARRTIEWVQTEIERGDDGGPLSDAQVSALWIRANIFYFSDELDAAATAAAEGHARAVRAPNRTVTAGSAATLAYVHFLRGEYADALRWADESLPVAEAIGNIAGFPGPAAVALVSRVELGQPTDAERYLDLLDQAVASGNSVQSNLRFVADALLAVRDTDRAARLVETLRHHPIGSGRLRQIYEATVVGDLLRHLGRHDEAARSFAHAVDLAELIGARSALVAALVGAAELALDRGDEGAALAQLRQATPIARELRLGRHLGRIERLLGRPASALTGAA
jgi:class 3 adenylate cyclase/tetratricopeptide (TPR) repeat protein